MDSTRTKQIYFNLIQFLKRVQVTGEEALSWSDAYRYVSERYQILELRGQEFDKKLEEKKECECKGEEGKDCECQSK